MVYLFGDDATVLPVKANYERQAGAESTRIVCGI